MFRICSTTTSTSIFKDPQIKDSFRKIHVTTCWNWWSHESKEFNFLSCSQFPNFSKTACSCGNRLTPWKASKLIKIDCMTTSGRSLLKLLFAFLELLDLYHSPWFLMFKGFERSIHRHVWRSSNTWLQLLEVPKISASCREAGTGWDDAMACYDWKVLMVIQ